MSSLSSIGREKSSGARASVSVCGESLWGRHMHRNDKGGDFNKRIWVFLYSCTVLVTFL